MKRQKDKEPETPTPAPSAGGFQSTLKPFMKMTLERENEEVFLFHGILSEAAPGDKPSRLYATAWLEINGRVVYSRAEGEGRRYINQEHQEFYSSNTILKKVRYTLEMVIVESTTGVDYAGPWVPEYRDLCDD